MNGVKRQSPTVYHKGRGLSGTVIVAGTKDEAIAKLKKRLSSVEPVEIKDIKPC